MAGGSTLRGLLRLGLTFSVASPSSDSSTDCVARIGVEGAEPPLLLKACAVFSKARGNPMSYQSDV